MPDDKRPCDEYGRAYGEPLWRGGPILGGENWQAFLAAKRAREAEAAPLPKVRSRPTGGTWE